MVRRRFHLPLICHASAWAILGCAFVMISVPHVWAALRTYRFGPMLPFHTTNSYMVSLLKVQDGSERVMHALSSLPPQQPVAVILRDGDDESIFLGYLVSYFAWPREVQPFPVTRANAASQLQSIDRASVAAIFFCGLDPPAGMEPVIPLGTRLTMVPMAPSPHVP